jgi:ring-1,2-phenylacetyl-CoA epoxidase subunit PaaC
MTCTSDRPIGPALAYGDDALIAAQRLIDWVARAPALEEDVAVANIALDLLGQARALLAVAGLRATPPRTEDDLAYLRGAGEYRNAVLLERANGDFAVTMVRLLLFSAYAYELYASLARTVDADPDLAAVAAKAVPELRYHREHARGWVVRLGDGTEESRRRTEAALAGEWPWFGGLFAPVPDSPVDHATLAPAAHAWVADVLAEATLTIPTATDAGLDGRAGLHTADLDALLEEFQSLARAHPGATW